MQTASYLKLLLRPLVALLTTAGLLSTEAQAADWQNLSLPKLGELRWRHPASGTAVNTAQAEATAQTLTQWTRDRLWDPMRVIVDDSHALVRSLKSGSVLVLTPADASLPVIWLSLDPDPKKRRAVLEDRKTGDLTLNALPSGAALDLHWLGL